MIDSTHPSAEELGRYRRRGASPADTLAVDAHIAACDHCFAKVRADIDAITLAEPEERHLHYDQMEAVVDGRADGHASRHASACGACAREIADLREMREAMGRAPARPAWWQAAAAAVLIVVLAGLWMATRQAPSPAPVARKEIVTPRPAPQPEEIVLQRPAILDSLVIEGAVLRGTARRAAFALHEPIGTVVVDDRPHFRWSPVRGATSYTVVVADAETGDVHASGSTAATSWRPSTALRRGRTYMWQVTAQTGGGALVAPSPSERPALVRVAETVELPEAPLARGVALAEIGALDDAERELERALASGDARAARLLAQVRSWRQRASPTTTNGVQ